MIPQISSSQSLTDRLNCKIKTFSNIDKYGRVDSYFDVYDWSNDDGYNSFGEWVEKAAKEAGR